MMEENKWHHHYILLCDDDDDDRFFFTDIVNELNDRIVVKSVNNYDQLLKELNTCGPPDLLFLDLNMPGKTGFECIEMIKKQENQNFPIIIYSTSANKRDLDETYNKGAHLYMKKATSVKALKSSLKKVLQTPRQHLLNVKKTQYFFENGD